MALLDGFMISCSHVVQRQVRGFIPGSRCRLWSLCVTDDVQAGASTRHVGAGHMVAAEQSGRGRRWRVRRSHRPGNSALRKPCRATSRPAGPSWMHPWRQLPRSAPCFANQTTIVLGKVSTCIQYASRTCCAAANQSEQKAQMAFKAWCMVCRAHDS